MNDLLQSLDGRVDDPAMRQGAAEAAHDRLEPRSDRPAPLLPVDWTVRAPRRAGGAPTQLSDRHRVLALSASVLMHVGVAAALLWQSPSPGARGAGIGGIEVSLVLVGGAPGSAGSAAPEAETETATSEAATERPLRTASATPPDPVAPQAAAPVEAEMAIPVERPSEVPPVDAAEVPPAVEAPAPRPAEEVEEIAIAEAVPAVTAEAVPVEEVDEVAVVEAAPVEEVDAVEVAEAAPVEDIEAAETPEAMTIEEADAIEVAEAVPIRKIDAVETPDVTRIEEIETAGQTPPAENIRAQRPDPAAEAKPEDLVTTQAAPPPPTGPKPRLPDRQQAEALPQPRPAAVRETPQEGVQTAESVREKGKERAPAAAPSAPGGGGKAGTQAGPGTGSAEDAAGGGRPGDTVDYMAVLQAWLEKYKEYPRRAQLRRQEGTVLLYFIMDRKGRVLDYRIRRSSGHALLDRAAAEMIERAQPLPRMPDAMHQARLELVVPVRFLLR